MSAGVKNDGMGSHQPGGPLPGFKGAGGCGILSMASPFRVPRDESALWARHRTYGMKPAMLNLERNPPQGHGARSETKGDPSKAEGDIGDQIHTPFRSLHLSVAYKLSFRNTEGTQNIHSNF